MNLKIAVLMQCHKLPKQINMLINMLKNDTVTIFVHVDLKSDIHKDITSCKNVILLPEELRVDVMWGDYSQVIATLNLIKYASSYDDFDYYCLISGQDFPVMSMDNLISFLDNGLGSNYVNLFLSKNNGLNVTNNYDKRNNIFFASWMMKRTAIIRIIKRMWIEITGGYNRTFKCFIRKKPCNIDFYYGSSWWCIHMDFVHWILEYLNKYPQIEEFFKNCSCPDESFFQTLLMNSPFAATRKDYLHYIDWSENKNSPKNLTCADFDNIISSKKYFARKIDGNFDLINMLCEYIKND